MTSKTVVNSIKLYKEGKIRESIADLQEIIVSENNPSALFNLSYIYANIYKSNIEKLQEAKQYLSNAQDLGFDSERIKKLNKSIDYILIGDFNSNYNEFETIRLDKKLNNTNGLTGINHVLNTMLKDTYIDTKNILNYKQRVHYNLWHEFDYENKFSKAGYHNNRQIK